MAGKQAVTKAKMERAAKAVQSMGLKFQGFRIHPNGDVDVLAGESSVEIKMGSNNPGRTTDELDDELAEYRRENGYGG